MKGFFLAGIFAICTYTSFSQIEREDPQEPATPQIQLEPQQILGKVLDEKTVAGWKPHPYSFTGTTALVGTA